MRIYLIGAVLCLILMHCRATPVVTITADTHQEKSLKNDVQQTEIEKQGEVQEETQGVFKKIDSDSDKKEDNKVPEVEEQKPKEEPKPSTEQAKQEPATSAKSSKSLKHKGRQSEDDDDDDDDDIDLGIDGDDDDDDDDETASDDADDDDDEEDDDDEDYFERFFDDILGGGDDDDDDDDDDDVSPSTGSQAVVAESNAVAQSAIEPAASASNEVPTSEEQLNSVNGDLQDGETNDAGTEESLIEKDPLVEPVQNTVQTVPQVVVQPVPANDDSDSDDDDDDDDDDDGLGGLTDDDDDDEDDDDEAADDDDDDEDEDDDDETDLEDVIDARRARAAPQAIPKMPAIYKYKYNRFVDNVIARINRILGKSYDPVRVRLLSNVKKDKSNQKKKTGTRKTVKKNAAANKMGELEIARSKYQVSGENSPKTIESESREPAFVLISRTGSGEESGNLVTEVRGRPVGNTQKRKTNKRKSTTKATTPTSLNKNTTTKSKTKQANKTKNKARATLFGLSSLKRDGDVTVNVLPDHTMVKTNFILGPLTLRVEREFGKGERRELKSATATTTEMFGRLNLKIVHGGAATLSAIKVLQPKQVRVDSADNHDKTTEFMWKRSPQIATMVSQKLSSATKSMLKPVPATKQ